MTVTMQDIQVVHDATGADLAHCKTVLEATGGDIERAEALLLGTETQSLREIATAARAREAGRHVIYLAGTDRVGVVPIDQADLMVTLAKDLNAQSGRMTQQADRLAALVAFTTRMEEAMAAARGAAVRLDVEPQEEQIATFLLTQARARAAVVDRTRYKHVCQTCGKSRLTNPAYEQQVERQRKRSAASRGVGVALFAGAGASPIVMLNSILAFRTQKPDYHCTYCQSLDTDQSAVVFCPQCKALNDKPVLKQCPKCHFDFLKDIDVSDIWQSVDSVAVPPPAGEKLNEFQINDEPTFIAFLPGGHQMLTASQSRSVQLWELGDTPRSLWTAEIGGVIKASKPPVALSPDGQWVAVAKPQTPRVRILRAADGVQVGECVWALADGSTPSHLAFRPDSRALAVSCAYIDVWGLDGRRMHRMKLGAITMPGPVAWSHDGAYIATPAGSWSNNKLFVWRAIDGYQIAKLTVPGSITALAWTPDPTTIALAIGKQAVLINVPSGQRPMEFTLDAQVTAVAVSADGRYLAAASCDQSARVFDLSSRMEVVRISRPAEVTAVAFAPDGQLAVGDMSNAVQFWAPPQAGG